MHVLPAFVSLLSLSVTATLAVAADPSAGPVKNRCVVPFIITFDLAGPFRIALESTDSSVNGRTVSFLRRGNTLQPGIYRKGRGSVESMSLRSGKLLLTRGPVAFFVEPRGRPRFRRVAFASSPPTPAATFESFHKCSPTGHAETALRLAEDDAGLCSSLLPFPRLPRIYVDKRG